MNTRLTMNRPGRAVAAVGAVVAVSATAMMALIAGTAAAAEPGRCVQAVNVRSEPSMDSSIVAVCEVGRQVQVGETRNGFVRLNDFSGWAKQEYVSINGAAPVVPSERIVPSQSPAVDSTRSPRRPRTTPTATPDPTPAKSPLDGTPLGGLLGGF